MITPSKAIKQYEDAIVEKLRETWVGHISSMDEEAVREGFWTKSGKYRLLGSGMQHLLEIISATLASIYTPLIEVSLLEADESYLRYKKELFKREHPHRDWNEYYKGLMNQYNQTMKIINKKETK